MGEIHTLVFREKNLSNAKIFGDHIETPIAISSNGYIGFIFEERKKNLFGDLVKTGKSNNIVVHISDVEGFDLIADESSGLGGAIVGGLLFDGAGAVVGGLIGSGKLKKLYLQIKVNDFHKPTFDILLYNRDGVYMLGIGEGSRGKKAVAEATELINTLSHIQSSYLKSKSAGATQISSADELIKFKGLLDSGVISQEEFDVKKKQLLGLGAAAEIPGTHISEQRSCFNCGAEVLDDAAFCISCGARF